MHHLFTTFYSLTQIDFTKGRNPRIMDMYNLNKRFLTSWNLGLQMLYFTLALMHELFLLNRCSVTPKLLQIVHKTRGYLFTALILPCTLVVASFFWIFYHLDKNYVFPVGADEVFPSWINHNIHTNILFLPIVELVLTKMYTPSFWNCFLGLTVFSTIYDFIYLFTYFDTGKWIYPLYDQISWTQRIMVFCVMYMTSLILCKIGIIIQNTKTKSCQIRKTNYKKSVATVTKKLL